jgi:hypothetical protein
MAGYEFIAADYLRSEETGPSIEMHCLPQREVLDLFQRSGCFVREIQPDSWIGNPGRWLSHTILAERVVEGHRDESTARRKRSTGFATPKWMQSFPR